MNKLSLLFRAVTSSFAFIALPLTASAHEVYVLTPTEIATALDTPRFSLIDVLLTNVHQFMFWAAVAVSTVLIVFLISIWRRFEEKVFPTIEKYRHHAPTISRITIGLSFMAAGYFGGAFGPELPLSAMFGNQALTVSLLLGVIGICITVGVFVRTAAAAALIFFISLSVFHGSYMLTYTNYLGEIIVLLLLGAHTLNNPTPHASVRHISLAWYRRLVELLAPYSFFILRVLFGISLIYSSLFAKVFHNNLALTVAASPLADHFYSIAHYLGFEPHFLVLGAAILEIVLGIFFILGIEIRFIALFIEFWLTLSLFYFGEAVWPHLVLIGIPIAFIFYGYDRYSIEGWLFKKQGREPVL